MKLVDRFYLMHYYYYYYELNGAFFLLIFSHLIWQRLLQLDVVIFSRKQEIIVIICGLINMANI